MNRGSVFPVSFCVVIVSGLLAVPAWADQIQQTVELGGKQLQIVTTDDSRTQARIDGTVMAEDAFIEVEAAFSAGDAGAVVLMVSDGGNGCPGNYVVVSVDAQGKAAATDPFGTCSDEAETSAKDGILTVRFAPIGGEDGTIYRWSFATGLQPPVTEPFQPKPGTSWADAADLAGKQPWAALDNADVYAAFKALLGDDFNTFTDYFDESDAMTTTADGIVVGETFDNSTEESTAMLIGVDPRNRKVYAVMQDGDEAPRFYPAKEQWPASLQEKLKQWP